MELLVLGLDPPVDDGVANRCTAVDGVLGPSDRPPCCERRGTVAVSWTFVRDRRRVADGSGPGR